MSITITSTIRDCFVGVQGLERSFRIQLIKGSRGFTVHCSGFGFDDFGLSRL